MTLTSVLVGTGRWAEVHAQAYRLCHDIRLVGICGHANRERVTSVADRYNIEHRSLQLATLLRETEPDIVDIVCHPEARLDVVKEVVQCPSVKLINIEKPLALAPSQAEEIRQCCTSYDKLVVVNHQHKFLPSWAKAKQLLQDGAIGNMEFIRASTRANLMEQGSHLIDMMLFFTDYCHVSWVMGQTDGCEGSDGSAIPAPEAAIAAFGLQNGVRVFGEFGSVGRTVQGETNPFYHIGVDVYGTEGHLAISLNQSLAVVNSITHERRVEPSSWTEHYVEAQAAHLDSIAAYVRNPAAGHLSDMNHSLLSFQVMMAICHSAAKGGKVVLPAVFDDSIVEHYRIRR